MTDKPNRRELLIETAASLFQNQGYNATSVRQIADLVGVTEAALYYHFKDGKRELLQAVIQNYTPHLMILSDDYAHIPTLSEFIVQFIKDQNNAYNLANVPRLRWLLMEYPNLSADEQSIFHKQGMEAHHSLANAIQRYVSDRHTANQFAWILITMLFGYGQLFLNLGFAHVTTDFEVEDATQTIAKLFEDVTK
jgi:AcrR family transcriptional regulator